MWGSRAILLGSNDSGGIEWGTFSSLFHSLQELVSENSDPIWVVINSPGGDYDQAVAIYDLLRFAPVQVNTIGIGECMSAGSLVLQAGCQRYLTPNCTLLAHDGQIGMSCQAKSIWGYCEFYADQQKGMLDIYAEKWKGSREDLINFLGKDVPINAEAAITLGLADSIWSGM